MKELTSVNPNGRLYEEINILQTRLCLLKNPQVHPFEEESILPEPERNAAIAETEDELADIFKLASGPWAQILR